MFLLLRFEGEQVIRKLLLYSGTDQLRRSNQTINVVSILNEYTSSSSEHKTYVIESGHFENTKDFEVNY